MGLDINAIKYLLYLKSKHIDFGKFGMLGRQSLYGSHEDIIKAADNINISLEKKVVDNFLTKNNGFSEQFFEYLGAKSIDSFDCSDYQGATNIFDFNEYLPDSLKSKYDFFLDSGSLEHIYNFPVAIQNCMDLLKPGGHFLCITPVNNFMGHGFYQFSPELFYNVLSVKNGFDIRYMLIYRENNKKESIFYKVMSPEVAKSRVMLTNCYPTMLLVLAQKIKKF